MLPASQGRRIEILGVPISLIDTQRAVAGIGTWIRERRDGQTGGRYVCVCDVHNVMRAQDDGRHMEALRSAHMATPDGMPLVWISRLRGERGISRVAGADLMSAICAQSRVEGWSHYFYGGAPGVAGQMAERLALKHEGLNIAGTWCPPFRPMTGPELDADIARINASGADIVWVGLGCPKQEIWMLENHARLEGRVVIGVGAAFDFHSGRIERAPLWMRERGLEWLHRLMSEPRRLWRRYLVLAPRFLGLTLAESAGVRSRRVMAERVAKS